MKLLYIVIAITLALMFIVNTSAVGLLNFITTNVNNLTVTAMDIVGLGGYHENNSGLSMPIETVNFGTLSYGDEIGLVNVKQYIKTYMIPSWAKQDGDYSNNITFDCQCYIYVDYFEGTIRTSCTVDRLNTYFPTYIPKSIYSGKMIRIDYIITANLNKNDLTFGVNKHSYSVYVFPINNELQFYCAYGLDADGYVSKWYNSVDKLLNWNNPNNIPILKYPNGNLMGSQFIDPSGNANQYTIENVRLTTDRIDTDKNIFKEFMKG